MVAYVQSMTPAKYQSWLKYQSTAISNANDQVAQLRRQLTATNNLGI